MSILVEAMNKESLRGAPGAEISLTSFKVTPVVSPSPPVELTTPSYFWPILVEIVTVVPYMHSENQCVNHSSDMQARTIKPVRGCRMRSGSWGRAPFCWFKGGNEPVSLGCCCDVGKRPEFMAGEKVGEAREPFQAVRLGKRLLLRSMGAGQRVGDERRVICRRPTAGLNQA